MQMLLIADRWYSVRLSIEASIKILSAFFRLRPKRLIRLPRPFPS